MPCKQLLNGNMSIMPSLQQDKAISQKKDKQLEVIIQKEGARRGS